MQIDERLGEYEVSEADVLREALKSLYYSKDCVLWEPFLGPCQCEAHKNALHVLDFFKEQLNEHE